MNGPVEPPDRLTALAADWDNGQQVIASCMSAAGFRYTPLPSNPEHQFASASWGRDLDLIPVPRLSSDRSIVAHYGYGVLPPPEDDPRFPTEAEDPNVAYRSTLSQTEASAYDLALYGDLNKRETWTQSCSAQAAEQSADIAPGPVQAFLTEFGDLARAARWSAVEGLMESAPVAQLSREWESCMNANGVTFDARLSDKGPGIALARAINTRSDGTVGPWRADTPTAEIPVEEKSLTGSEFERAIALQDFDCRTQTDYVARLTALRIQSDNDFIEKNRDALNRLLAAAEAWS
ncbi:MAG: hypothetical protein LBV00_10090 [Propionibacteriaceae bacterium]|jgi:hypothetical protein|nr:hypothetical protein [Propionibacteriaceae bacterium]